MSPTDDRDIRAALSRDPYPSGATRLSTDADGAVVPSLEPHPLAICAEDEAAVDALMRRCHDARPPGEPQPDPLREAVEAMRDALEWLTCASHHRAHRRGECSTCRERWPCDVEQARRRLAAALEAR